MQIVLFVFDQVFRYLSLISIRFLPPAQYNEGERNICSAQRTEKLYFCPRTHFEEFLLELLSIEFKKKIQQ